LLLIRVVKAVVIPVTDPSLRDAALVRTSEVPGIGAGLDWRLLVRISDTILLVIRESFPVGTGTSLNEAGSSVIGRNWEAELLTPSVLKEARVAAVDALVVTTEHLDAIEAVPLLDRADDPLF